MALASFTSGLETHRVCVLFSEHLGIVIALLTLLTPIVRREELQMNESNKIERSGETPENVIPLYRFRKPQNSDCAYVRNWFDKKDG
ncbi:MAG: hypothetical protein COB36_11500 [Alphaproteobacteria bacterium]|nr:MAG: hypothetical protein COB36_11500 [Alphaproteobacteria bacterium]